MGFRRFRIQRNASCIKTSDSKLALNPKFQQAVSTGFPFLAALTLCAAISPAKAQEKEKPFPSPTEVQKKATEWVLTRKLISEEDAAWQGEKASLADLNAIRLKETEQLEEFVKLAGSRVEELAGKRATFTKEESELKAWRAELERKVVELETGLKPLIADFPAPLRDKIQESLIRIEAAEVDQALQNRARDILLVLQACLEFQNAITVHTDVREIDGERREVEVIYLGMTQAWYVDASNKHSGYGVPGSGAWEWTEDNSIASRVRSTLEIQTRQATPAFVELPLSNGARGKENAK